MIQLNLSFERLLLHHSMCKNKQRLFLCVCFFNTLLDETFFMVLTDAAHILENLRPNTKYIFRFAAVNDVGEGPYSALVEQFMPATSAPQVPAIVTQPGPDGYIYSNYSSLAQIRWRIPHNNGAPIIKYTLTYCVVSPCELKSLSSMVINSLFGSSSIM